MTDERREEKQDEPAPDAAEPAESAADTESTASTEPAAAEPETTQGTATPPPPPAQPIARRLVRRAEGKMIAGVCSGLGAYLGVDPVLVRVGFVLATILGGGTGLVAYIVLWLIMPMAPEGEPLPPAPHTDWFDSSSVWRWTAVGLIIAAVFLLSNNIWHFRPSLFWGLLLLGVGVALWSREMHVRGNGDRPKPPTPPAPRPEPITGASDVTTPLPPRPPTRPSPAAPIAPPQRRPPSALGRLVVGAAALAVGIMFLLDNLRAVHVTARMGMAVILAVIGLGLLVGSFCGRAHWLIIPGVVLSFIVAGVSLVPDAGPRTGNVEWVPNSLAELRTHYRHGAGNVVLDLRNVKFDSQPRTIRVRIGFGNLEIIVPEDVPVQAESHVRGGKLDLFGHESDGWNINEAIYDGGESKIGQLTIRTDAGFGNTEVRRPRPGEASNNSDSFQFNFGPVDVRSGHR